MILGHPDKISHQSHSCVGIEGAFLVWGLGGVAYLTLSSALLYTVCVNTKLAYKSNRNVYYSCKYHVVWCPKYRRKVLVEDTAERLKQIISEVCQEHLCLVLSLEIMSDHVHLLVECDPQFGIHRLVRLIKGRSSRLLRQEFPSLKTRMPTLWTISYFVSTVGGAPLSVMKQYIENQKHV
jgi:putative transposase